MALYVLLEFANDSDANEFIESHEELNLDPVEARVVATFKKPTKFCQCGEQRFGVLAQRGKKYGWYICGRCHLPDEKATQIGIYNLLEADQPPWKKHLLLQTRPTY